MIYTIPCDTFRRLAVVTGNTKPNETSEFFNSIYIEHKDGDAIAVASNMWICAAEYIGRTTQPNGFINVAITEQLVKQCDVEAPFASKFEITHVAMLNIATLKSTFGFSVSDVLFKSSTVNWLKDWRSIVPKAMPRKSKGTLKIVAEQTTQLARSAPSGRIIFPEFIDVDQVVVVRDSIDPNWVAFFKPDLSNRNPPKITEASIPEWIR